MEAVEYLKERKRMCVTINPECCIGCPLSYSENGTGLGCGSFQNDYPERAVEIVEKWSKEHPVKTIMQDFLEKYPNARIRLDGIPCTCASLLGYKPVDCHCVETNCKKCWNTPLE